MIEHHGFHRCLRIDCKQEAPDTLAPVPQQFVGVPHLLELNRVAIRWELLDLTQIGHPNLFVSSICSDPQHCTRVRRQIQLFHESLHTLKQAPLLRRRIEGRSLLRTPLRPSIRQSPAKQYLFHLFQNLLRTYALGHKFADLKREFLRQVLDQILKITSKGVALSRTPPGLSVRRIFSTR